MFLGIFIQKCYSCNSHQIFPPSLCSLCVCRSCPPWRSSDSVGYSRATLPPLSRNSHAVFRVSLTLSPVDHSIQLLARLAVPNSSPYEQLFSETLYCISIFQNIQKLCFFFLLSFSVNISKNHWCFITSGIVPILPKNII